MVAKRPKKESAATEFFFLYVVSLLPGSPCRVERWSVTGFHRGKVYATLTHLDGSKERLQNWCVFETFDCALGEAHRHNDALAKKLKDQLADLETVRQKLEQRRCWVVERRSQAQLTHEDLEKML